MPKSYSNLFTRSLAWSPSALRSPFGCLSGPVHSAEHQTCVSQDEQQPRQLSLEFCSAGSLPFDWRRPTVTHTHTHEKKRRRKKESIFNICNEGNHQTLQISMFSAAHNQHTTNTTQLSCKFAGSRKILLLVCCRFHYPRWSMLNTSTNKIAHKTPAVDEIIYSTLFRQPGWRSQSRPMYPHRPFVTDCLLLFFSLLKGVYNLFARFPSVHDSGIYWTGSGVYCWWSGVYWEI